MSSNFPSQSETFVAVVIPCFKVRRYIIDSLGWAYFAKRNYIEAGFFLQRATELLPSDPIINDHYADTLWMLDKHIQARYVWRHVLELDTTQQELKDIINKKLIFGITKKL